MIQFYGCGDVSPSSKSELVDLQIYVCWERGCRGENKSSPTSLVKQFRNLSRPESVDGSAGKQI